MAVAMTTTRKMLNFFKTTVSQNWWNSTALVQRLVTQAQAQTSQSESAEPSRSSSNTVSKPESTASKSANVSPALARLIRRGGVGSLNADVQQASKAASYSSRTPDPKDHRGSMAQTDKAPDLANGKLDALKTDNERTLIQKQTAGKRGTGNFTTLANHYANRFAKPHSNEQVAMLDQRSNLSACSQNREGTPRTEPGEGNDSLDDPNAPTSNRARLDERNRGSCSAAMTL